MSDSRPDGNSKPSDESGEPKRELSSAGTPRWVKVFGIIAIVLVVLVVIALLAGGEHGPGRHMP